MRLQFGLSAAGVGSGEAPPPGPIAIDSAVGFPCHVRDPERAPVKSRPGSAGAPGCCFGNILKASGFTSAGSGD